MRILILGGDGYLGWPTGMYLSGKGHECLLVDNYSRRHLAEKFDSEPLFETPNLSKRCDLYGAHIGNHNLQSKIIDLAVPSNVFELLETWQPDVIIHYAEQPSAPLSMMNFENAQYTLQNNLNVTFNVLWGMIKHCPNAHLVKLGTMGEYGTPNIDIEEGWLEVEHKGRNDRFLYPRAAGSLYHTTKVLDTDLIWFYVRTYDLRVTDLMQGPVYGFITDETSELTELYPNFHYDDIFGTVLNRFLVQAVCGNPLTVYGKGGQTRGYLNLKDTLRCVELAIENRPEKPTLEIFNQFTETFSVNDLAEKVKQAADTVGLKVQINHVKNPRKEKEDHYYNPKSDKFKDLGLEPHLLTERSIVDMLTNIMKSKQNIKPNLINPRVHWS